MESLNLSLIANQTVFLKVLKFSLDKMERLGRTMADQKLKIGE